MVFAYLSLMDSYDLGFCLPLKEIEMAKDPAVLFYTADFMIGTLTFTNEQVGMYIRLLCHQHQNGRFTKEHAIRICGSVDDVVLEKFSKDKSGFYYNIRMEEEAKKRSSFCKSRKENAQKGKECKRSRPKAYAEHMVNENEDVIVDVNVNTNTDNNDTDIGEEDMKKPKPPTSYEEVVEYAKTWNREDIALKFWEHFEAGEWYDTEGKPVLNWKQKFVTWKNRNAPAKDKQQIKTEQQQWWEQKEKENGSK